VFVCYWSLATILIFDFGIVPTVGGAFFLHFISVVVYGELFMFICCCLF
jgi:hypothetical protein